MAVLGVTNCPPVEGAVVAQTEAVVGVYCPLKMGAVRAQMNDRLTVGKQRLKTASYA